MSIYISFEYGQPYGAVLMPYPQGKATLSIFGDISLLGILADTIDDNDGVDVIEIAQDTLELDSHWLEIIRVIEIEYQVSVDSLCSIVCDAISLVYDCDITIDRKRRDQ